MKPALAAPVGEPPQRELERVAECWAEAMEGLGWLGRSAHTGHFMKTASSGGHLPRECEALVDDTRSDGLALATGHRISFVVDHQRSQGRELVSDVRFSCLGDTCEAFAVLEVVLPRGPWFCFNWTSGPRSFGDECYRGKPACNKERAVHGRRATPCTTHEGAAYCRGPDSCYPSPWSCWRSGPQVDRATCRRTDR